MTPESYTIIFNKYWKAIVYFANKKLNDMDMAEDVAQGSFLKLHNAFERMEKDQHCKAFLYVVARNECYNIKATEKRHRKVGRPEEIAVSLAEDILPDFDVIETEILTFIAEKIEELPARSREGIKLLFSGMKSDDAAKQMKCTRKTLLNQKLKAIAYIKEQIKLRYG